MGTKDLVNKGYCLALISEMDEQQLDKAIAALEQLIKQRKSQRVRGIIELTEARSADSSAAKPAPEDRAV